MPERNGFIAILDALGAANYSKNEIFQFLESRKRVLSLLESKADALLGSLVASRVSTFTFNDTVLIAYPVENHVSVDDISAFGILLRHFQVKSIANGILFRGAMSIGTFYLDEETNTIMGPAVRTRRSFSTTLATPFPTQITRSGFSEVTTCFVYNSHDSRRTSVLLHLEIFTPFPSSDYR